MKFFFSFLQLEKTYQKQQQETFEFDKAYQLSENAYASITQTESSLNSIDLDGNRQERLPVKSWWRIQRQWWIWIRDRTRFW